MIKGAWCLLAAVIVPVSSPAQDARVPVEPAAAAESAPENRGDAVTGAILEAAGLGKDDVVYDIGYGDGKMLVEAARRYGCRGVGIYGEPGRIADGIRSARESGVAGRVSFGSQDIFHTSISDASVVVLCLLPRDGIRLRPKLLSGLRPGTLVFSRDFSLGEWRPQGHMTVAGCVIYYWVIPANVSGLWKWKGSGNQRFSLRVDQRFQDADARLAAWPLKASVKSFQIEADRVSVSVETEYAAKRRTINFEGRISGDVIEGFGEEEGKHFPWKTERTSGSVRPVDTAKDAVD